MLNIIAYNASQTYNFIEAFIWMGIAVFCIFKLPKATAALKSTLILLAITLIVFGLSDLIEIRTGSWWSPWWMLLWKAICLISIVLCIGKFYIHSKK